MMRTFGGLFCDVIGTWLLWGSITSLFFTTPLPANFTLEQPVAIPPGVYVGDSHFKPHVIKVDVGHDFKLLQQEYKENGGTMVVDLRNTLSKDLYLRWSYLDPSQQKLLQAKQIIRFSLDEVSTEYNVSIDRVWLEDGVVKATVSRSDLGIFFRIVGLIIGSLFTTLGVSLGIKDWLNFRKRRNDRMLNHRITNVT